MLPHPSRSRGFTLAEVLIVLAMISVLVVAASPTFVKLLRDRRVNRAASQLVDLMRSARTMAIGRGQPMLVAWNGNGVLAQTHPGGTGFMEVDEPIVPANAAAGAACAVAPGTYWQGTPTTCSTTLWHTNGCTQQVWTFDIQNGLYDYTAIKFYSDDGTTPMGAEICFSPTGRTYLRTGPAGAVTGTFSPTLGVPSFAVFNTDTNPGMFLGSARWAYLQPDGVARLGL